MINKFARTASTYTYYNYLNRYTPEQLRTFQSERYYCLGRRGAFDTLVLKMSGDHMNLEEDFNLRYKIPISIIFLSQRLAIFWSLSATAILMFCLGDMTKAFRPVSFYYRGTPSNSGEVETRYETLYVIKYPMQKVI
jgi:hypothetical protein